MLPAFDNAPQEEIVVVEGRHTNYVARLNNTFAGAAFEAVSRDGYGGEIRVMVGVNANNKVQGIKILQHKETPGLGAKIEGREFRNTFGGAPIDTTDWRVTKDGGDIDAITAATLSSRAVAGAVRKGLGIYKRNRQQIEGLPQ